MRNFGTLTLVGRRTVRGFEASGTGSLLFTGTAIGDDGSTERLRSGRATVRTDPTLISGSTVVFEDVLLTFLGGHTEGTGI